MKKTDKIEIEKEESYQITDMVEKIEKKLDFKEPDRMTEKIQDLLNKEEKEKVLEAALIRHHDKDELQPYQAELIKLQHHLENTGMKMIILFDGRDASGKGGTIRRIIRYMNPKHYRVIVLGKPNSHQKTELHMKRYIEHFPHAGEIVLFDRSWYNRAMIEPVMGFCTQKEYKRFMKKVTSYEENFITDRKTILLKLYFSVSKEEQQRRFERRKNDPLRQWKLSEVDLQAQDLWDEVTKKKFKLLQKTHTKTAPWYIIRSDDKHLARKETMKVMLNAARYRGRSRMLDFLVDTDIVIPGDKELKIMVKQQKKHGKPLA